MCTPQRIITHCPQTLEAMASQVAISDIQNRARKILISCDQSELIKQLDEKYESKWSPLFCEQVLKLDANYPGGLVGYVLNAKKLLSASNSGENPLADVTSVEVPKGVNLDYGSEEFCQFEESGSQDIPFMCFVLVAGGLGERLGYSGIKLSLPIDLASNQTYLGNYCDTILALSNRSGVDVPLVIMTSDDTHDRTVELLRLNSNFGMKSSQIRLIKQEKVAALVNADGGMLLDEQGMLLTKPHGHGDVHLLLHQTGIAREWHQQGKKWVCFFQDTNGLVFKTMLAVVGVSKLNKFDLNSMCIPRLAKQEIGAITTLHFKDGKSITANTEYNQLGPLLAALGSEGDVPDRSGFSPYPGNINQLVVSLDTYVDTLEATKGIMEEFVNPKYTDASRTTFKKPTRLECMMQDYAKVLPPSASVGFTTSAAWIGYAPAKNSLAEGVAKLRAGCDPMTASTAEASMYSATCEIWRQAGCQIEAPVERQFGGVPVKLGPILSISPHFALTAKELSQKLPQPSQVKVSFKGALVIVGSADVVVESLDLDGALIVDTRNCYGSVKVVIKDVVVKNSGWEFVSLQGEAAEFLAIRGYELKAHETEKIIVPRSLDGCFLITSVSGEVQVRQTNGFAVMLRDCVPCI